METQTENHFLTDLKLALKRKGAGGLVRDIFLHPGNQAIALYRVYRWLYLKGHVNLAFLGYRLNYFFCGVEINPDADIGPDFHLDHPLAVLIRARLPACGKGCASIPRGSWGRWDCPAPIPSWTSMTTCRSTTVPWWEATASSGSTPKSA